MGMSPSKVYNKFEESGEISTDRQQVNGMAVTFESSGSTTALKISIIVSRIFPQWRRKDFTKALSVNTVRHYVHKYKT